MWQFITGFSLGVYVGTFYDCKPALEYIRKTIKEHIPERNKEDSKDPSEKK